MFRVDHNRCVLCTRCVRVCDEIEGAHTWDVMGRGSGCQVITDLAKPWGDSETCTSCGKCVQVCPTGALTEKGHAVAEMRKQSQFLPYLKAPQGPGAQPIHERQDHRGHRVAGRLLGLPHVASWTWTSGCWTWPPRPTWSTARWWTQGAPRAGRPGPDRGRRQPTTRIWRRST
jgi:ferredoxin